MKELEKKLQVRNLRISFRTVSGKLQAVRDISFDLYKGETLAIVGESGSGKSVTSKAILGILANNSIVEGGEILYDGQDLLKISEDDFYRLRGDKVAMIFQDPLSSLNPIMRIGKQLTEAMILKGKARQRSSKDNFNTKIDLLEKYMCEAEPQKAEQLKGLCATFRKSVSKQTELQLAYNTAHEAAEEALVEIEHVLFLITKKAFSDLSEIRQIKEFAKQTMASPYVVAKDDPELTKLIASLEVDLKGQAKSGDFSSLALTLEALQKLLQKALDQAEPAFLAIGYFMEFGHGNAPTGSIEQANEFYLNYLNENFLHGFYEAAKTALTSADAKFLGLRQTAVAALEKALNQLKGCSIDEFKSTVAPLCETVNASINPIDIVKDSAACTFSGALKDFVSTYDMGKRTNDKKIAKYNRQVKRLERKKKRGADYKVAAPSIVDFDLVKTNMLTLIEHMMAHYVERNEAEARDDKGVKTDRLIDYLEENAAGMVYKITKQAAKNKALKLMEEVGISEPRKRYRQYPFEFSGGMRQRIVIAIALAANPDILICDEPTTALDVTIQAQILELINNLKAQRNLSIIFITHDLGVVANMADRIAVMYAGKIVEYGTAEEIFYEPAHPYTWALLSSMPDLDTKEKLEAIPGTPPNMIYPPKGDAFADRNRYAMKIDFEQQPPAFPITDTHWAATWLLHPNAPKIDPPKAVMDRIAKMKERVGGASNG